MAEIMLKGSGTTKKRKKTALGKGLGALIPDIDHEQIKIREYFLCDIHLIRPNKFQPRRQFPEKELAELCDSIKAQGIIQPLAVRKHESGYELITGERRFRAAKKANLSQVPVIVKNITDKEMLEMSIVENIQREDFNPIEEAEAYHRLVTEFNLTQDQAAARVGKSRSAVANFIRLRQLPEQIKENIINGDISMGHARALLGLHTPSQQRTAAAEIVAKKLSVRETENLIKRLKRIKTKNSRKYGDDEEPYFSDIANELSRIYQTKVSIVRKGNKGKVEVEFYDNDDLDRLIQLLRK
jgi:ParB family chromosome partitioning protein